MNRDDLFKLRPDSDLAKRIKDVMPTEIPLSKPVEPEKESVNLYQTNSAVWRNISESLLADYKYGWNIGMYGTAGDLSCEDFFKRLSSALIALVNNETQKTGKQTEQWGEHFIIIQSIVSLMAKKLEQESSKNLDPRSLVAVMQGFIDSYTNVKVIGGDKRINHGKS